MYAHLPCQGSHASLFLFSSKIKVRWGNRIWKAIISFVNFVTKSDFLLQKEKPIWRHLSHLTILFYGVQYLIKIKDIRHLGRSEPMWVACESTNLCLVDQLLHWHLTLSGEDLGLMSWQVNLKSRRRTALTPHSTANSKNEQKDEAQDWTSDRQHLNVTWLSVVPSAET